MFGLRTATAHRARRRGLTDRGRSLVAAGILLVAAGTLLGFPDLTRIGVLCLTLTALALGLAWRRRPRLEVHRRLLPNPLVSGQPGRIEVVLHNVGRRRTDLLTAREQVSPWLGPSARLVVEALRVDGRTRMSYDVRPGRRGRHQAGPLVAVWRDALGLSHGSVAVGDALDVLVLPPVHDLGGTDPAGLGLGHEGDVPASVLAGSEHDASVREYREGDDVRRVHWAVTAHRGELMVRNEALPRLRRAVLVLDSGPSWGAAADGTPTPAFEWAVEALASVAALLDSLGFTLHLLVGGQAALDDGADALLTAGSDGTHQTGRYDPSRPMRLPEVHARLALAEPGAADVPTGGRVSLALTATAREVAGSGGLVVLAVGDRESAASRDAFGILRTGTTGLAFVVDTAGLAARQNPTPGADSQQGAVGPAAERLCAYGRAGGWRTVGVHAGLSPAQAWTRLAGAVRAWSR